MGMDKEPPSIRTQSFKYRADVSMGWYDYQRLNSILEELHKVSIKVNPPYVDIFVLKDYYALLWDFYLIMSAILDESEQIIIDKQFDNIEKLMISFVNNLQSNAKRINFNSELPKALNNMNRKLYRVKQLIGMGINITRTESTKQRLRRVIIGE